MSGEKVFVPREKPYRSDRIDDLTVMGMMRGENSDAEPREDVLARWAFGVYVLYYGFIGWLIFGGLVR
jgi:hypothetical protein